MAGWVASLIGGQLAIAGLALMFLLAPDGHFLSRRWRYVAWGIGLGVAGTTAALLSLDPTTFDLAEEDVGPVRGSLFTVGFLLIAVGVLASGVSMVLRLRRSHGEQRQQLRLIAAGALFIVFGIASPVRGPGGQRRASRRGPRPCPCTSPTSCCRSSSARRSCATGCTTSR